MNIKEIRQRSGLTQKNFAEAIGIPYRTVIDWESGRRNPVEYLIKLIDYYLAHEKLYKEEK